METDLTMVVRIWALRRWIERPQIFVVVYVRWPEAGAGLDRGVAENSFGDAPLVASPHLGLELRGCPSRKPELAGLHHQAESARFFLRGPYSMVTVSLGVRCSQGIARLSGRGLSVARSPIF